MGDYSEQNYIIHSLFAQLMEDSVNNDLLNQLTLTELRLLLMYTISTIKSTGETNDSTGF